MIKSALPSDNQLSLDCRHAAAHAQQALAGDPPEASSGNIDDPGSGEAGPSAEGGQVSLMLARESVIGFAALIQPGFDVGDAVRRIRASASTDEAHTGTRR